MLKLCLIYLKQRLCFWYLNKPLKISWTTYIHCLLVLMFFIFLTFFFPVRVTECWRGRFCYIEINNLTLDVCQVFTGNRRPFDPTKSDPIHLLSTGLNIAGTQTCSQMFVFNIKQFDRIKLSPCIWIIGQFWKIYCLHEGFRFSSTNFQSYLLVLVCWFQWLCTRIFVVLMQFHLQYIMLVSFIHEVKLSMHRW